MKSTTTLQRAALRAEARKYATPQELVAATGVSIGKARRAFQYNLRIDNGEHPRRPGRDAGVIDGDYVTAYISAKQEEFAIEVGGNNLSAGVRIALEGLRHLSTEQREYLIQLGGDDLSAGVRIALNETLARRNNGWGCERCGGTVARQTNGRHNENLS